MKNNCFIYKNDLKFNKDIDLEISEFESGTVESIYKNFKNKPKIELRLEDSKLENYVFLDLSKLEINDDTLKQLFELNIIIKILNKIEFLDLSNNNLFKKPDLSLFPNIKFLNISFNFIEEDIYDNNLIELTCHNNNIKKINSSTIKRLNASNNNLKLLEIPNIEILIINSNKLDWIESYLNLVYLECIDNNIQKIDNMLNLEELYIANNSILSIKNMPKLKILNCINNPIKKINYFSNLKTLMVSIPIISTQYNVINISKIKTDYLINLQI